MGRVIVNSTLGRARVAERNGRRYYVAPASLITPGVLNGSKGALYYPPDETANNVDAWNGVPLTHGHPVGYDGSHVSGRDPDVIERQGLGYLYKATHNGKLRGEAWFDVEQTRALDKQFGSDILNRLEKGQPIELSTGLYTDNEPAPQGAQHKGRPYDFIARNYKPDHVAILPHQTGACSIEDGCGVLVNEEGAVKESASLLERFVGWLVGNRQPTINPFVSEAQRKACYARDDPGWDCDEWSAKTSKKLPDKVENDWSPAARDAALLARQKSAAAHKVAPDRKAEAASKKADETSKDAGTSKDHAQAAKAHEAAADAHMVASEKGGSGAFIHKDAADRHSIAAESHRNAAKGVANVELVDELVPDKVSVGAQVERVIVNGRQRWLVCNQPRHPSDGTFQGKAKNAAEDGYDDEGGRATLVGYQKSKDGRDVAELKPDGKGVRAKDEDDHWDDEENDAARPSKVDKVKRAKGTAHTDEDPVTSNQFGQTPAMPTMGGTDAHTASKQAAGHSVASEHPAARGHALSALDHSGDDNSKKAASSHVKAAEEHESAATEARSKGDHDTAFDHDGAAAAHRKAASMHTATCNAWTDEARAASAAARKNSHGVDEAGKTGKGARMADKAHAASEKGDHDAAAALHDKAAEYHEKTAESWDKRGNETAGDDHLGAAEAHRAAAAAHRKGATTNMRRNQIMGMDRDQLLVLVTNRCTCAKEKAAYPNLNTATLRAIAMNTSDESGDGSSTVQAGGEEDEDDEDTGISKKGKGLQHGHAVGQGKIKADDKGIQNMDQWLAAQPAEVQETFIEAAKVTHNRKVGLVRQLIANVRDDERRKKLAENFMGKKVAELEDLVSLMPVQQVPDRSPAAIFLGAEGGATQNVDDAADDTLEVVTLNYAEISRENGSRQKQTA